MTMPRILVAGIGNIFLGDDAFGVEVVQRLRERPLPQDVQVVDFGICGIDLTYALLDGYDLAVLVDAVPRGERPGTLYVIAPEQDKAEYGEQPPAGALLVDMHDLHPAQVLRLTQALGGALQNLLLVGCEPARVDDAEEIPTGLSEPVGRAVDEAVRMIEAIVANYLAGEREPAGMVNGIGIPQS